MAGRLRDPLVGRDVLWGLLMGLAWVVVFRTGYIFLMHAGAPPQFEMTDFLLGARQTLGTSLANVVNSVLGTLIFFFLAFILRVVFRNSRLAAADSDPVLVPERGATHPRQLKAPSLTGAADPPHGVGHPSGYIRLVAASHPFAALVVETNL